MIFGGVGPGYQYDFGVFDIADGICHGSASESCGQTGHGGGMSEPGAVVDIVCLEHGPGELVGNIVFLVGDPR